jgi:hypothetical protein
MPKVPLSTITSGYGTVDALNLNFDAIEAAFDNTLSRDGDTPNQMQANLDMNGFSILNQGNPIVVDGLNWRGNWATATAYALGDIVQTNGIAYICIVAHTSGVFATDLAAVRWQVFVQTNLPTQTGNSGRYLSTDGSLASWQPAVPDGTITTAKLANESVTFAKMQNINSGRLIGRSVTGAGSPEQISLGASLLMASGVLLSSRVINIRDYASLVVADAALESALSGGDWTPAFNAALAAAATSGTRTIYFPYIVSDNNGNYNFNTKPNVIGNGITLMGENPRQFLVRNYAPSGAAATAQSSFLVWDGSGYANSDPNQNKGGGMINLGVGAGNGTSTGCAIFITGADTNNRPGYMMFSNVVISGNGTWSFGVLLKGQDITTSGSQGMRDITFLGLYIFRCTGDPVQITNGVHIHIHGLTVSDGGAGNSDPTVRVSGGGTTLSNSTQVVMNNLDIEGTLAFSDCSRVVAAGYVNRISSTLSATQCKFIGIWNTNATTTGTTVI